MLISSDLCHKKMLLESLNIPLMKEMGIPIKSCLYVYNKLMTSTNVHMGGTTNAHGVLSTRCATGGVLRLELDRGVPHEPQNPYTSLRVILAEKGTHF